MLDVKWIRDNPEALTKALNDRGWLPDEALIGKLGAQSPDLVAEIGGAGEVAAKRGAFVAALIDLDARRRDLILKAETIQQKRNAASGEIGKAKAKKDEARAAELMAEVADLKAAMQAAEEERKAAEAGLDDVLAYVPNVPLPDVPVGVDERANVEYRRWGKAPAIAAPKEHYDLGEALGQMDFAAAAKLSGSRFTVLKAGLARMERALGQFMLDLHTGEHGYTEVAPPLLVNDATAYGTAQLPKFAADLFVTKTEELAAVGKYQIDFPQPGKLQVVFTGDESAESQKRFQGKVFIQSATRPIEEQIRPILEANRWLIPTAEVPLTNLVRDSIVAEADLPLRYTALTPCFRSEAGAAGRDTRGMLRQHQFNKVELVSITTPEQSAAEHERMLTSAEAVLRKLGLHYRVMTLSTGDMGFASQKTWDIEVWLPGQGTFREISSCSVCGDFQARRMQARFKPKDGKGNRLVHTLNGSGVAVGRALIAVMENYQNPDGSITVPDALKPYMGGIERVAK